MNDLDYLKKYLPKEQLDNGIKLLKKGIPVQYIVGDVDFYGNKIKVSNKVLIPRFETEGLVSKVCLWAKDKKGLDVLDLGTGSGCIAITLKKMLDDSKVVGIDISSDALKVAINNSKLNDCDVDFYISDMLDDVVGRFDIIVSNPPYISYDEEIMDIVKNNEPHIALYAANNGLYYYDKILRVVKDYLKPNYLLAFEIGYKQGRDVLDLVSKYLPGSYSKVCKDLYGKDRYVFISDGEICID